MLGEDRHEVFASPVLQVQHPGPKTGRPGGPGGLDDPLELLGSVGQSRQDRRHADAHVDPRCRELFDRPEALPGVSCAGLGLAPDLVVDGGDAEGDVQLGAGRQLAQHVEVTHDHRAARDHGCRVREFAQDLQTLAGQAVPALRGLVGVGRRSDDDGLPAPRATRKLAPQDSRDVDLDPDGAAVAVIGRPVGPELKGSDVAEGTAVLTSGIGVQGPRKAHVLDRVQRRLALDLEVVDVGEPRLGGGHVSDARTNVRLLQDPQASLMSEFGASPIGLPLRILRFGLVSEEGQKSFSAHSSHPGRRSSHTLLPWRIRRNESAVHSSSGTIEQTWYSILTGFLVFTSPSRLVSLITCVSTANPGTPKPAPRITLAVLRPIPGTLIRSSIVFGTSPPNSSTSLRLAAMILWVLARKNPVGLISLSTSAGSAAASSSAVG